MCIHFVGGHPVYNIIKLCKEEKSFFKDILTIYNFALGQLFSNWDMYMFLISLLKNLEIGNT